LLMKRTLYPPREGLVTGSPRPRTGASVSQLAYKG